MIPRPSNPAAAPASSSPAIIGTNTVTTKESDDVVDDEPSKHSATGLEEESARKSVGVVGDRSKSQLPDEDDEVSSNTSGDENMT